MSWVTVLVLAMMVASDYKLRRRTPGESLSGRADLTVIAEVVVYGLVLAFLVLQVRRPPRLQRTSMLLTATFAFGVALAASAFYAVYPTTALVRGMQLLVTCGLAYAIAQTAGRGHLHRLVHAYIALVTVSVLFGAVFPFPRTSLQANRFNWLHVHAVMAATYLGLSVVLLIGLLLRNRNRWPYEGWPDRVYLAMLVLHVVALLATRTRGGLAGCVAGSFVVAIASVRRKSRLDVAVLTVLAVGLATLIASEDILSFLARGESSESLRTLSARTELWEEAFRLFWERPLFGYGLTASRGLFFETVGLGGAHNALVNVMVDAGVVGVVVFVAILWTLVRSARSLRGVNPVGDDIPIVLGVFTFLIVNSFTAEYMATPANTANIWLFVLVGWVGVLHRLARERRGPSNDGVPGAPKQLRR